MEKWWKKPFRSVTLEFPAADIPTINLREIIDECNSGGVNVLNVFAIGYYPGGSAFYQSKIAPHYPTLKERDLLLESIEAAHRNGQKVIAYVASIWGNAELYAKNPDWAQVKKDGTINSWDDENNAVAMCPNSGYREYIASIVKEISENYDVDGFYFDEPSFQSWCACCNCREKYLKETGKELPVTENWQDKDFIKFIDWRTGQISEWRRSLYDLVKTDDRCVFWQGGFNMSMLPSADNMTLGIPYRNFYVQRFSDVNWYAPIAHGFDELHDAKIGDIVHQELYRRNACQPLWWYGIALRYAQALAPDKQHLVLNMINQSPFDAYGLPEDEIRVSFAEIAANNGSPLIARYYPDKVDKATWDIAYECMKELEECSEYLYNRDSEKYAAILYSYNTIKRNDMLKAPSHLKCVNGVAKVLLHNKILFDIVTEDTLKESISKYKVIILPNACYLSQETVRLLKGFSSAGGGLVVSYASAIYSDTGDVARENLKEELGIEYKKITHEFRGLDVYMKCTDDTTVPHGIRSDKLIPAGILTIDVECTEAGTIMRQLGASEVHYGPLSQEAGSSTVTYNINSGKGRSVYFAMPVGGIYYEYGVKDYADLLTAAVRWAAKSEPAVSLVNAPKTVELTAFNQPLYNRRIIHLVNSVHDEIMCPIDGLQAVRGVKVLMRTQKYEGNVFTTDGCELEFNRCKEGIEIHLPEFKHKISIVVRNM